MSAGSVDFVVRVNKKVWVGSGLFKSCNSFFSTQGAIFGSKSFDYTDWIALPDDAACYSSTLVDWRWICIMELGCKMFVVFFRFVAKFDKLLDFIEVLHHSLFELLLGVSKTHGVGV